MRDDVGIDIGQIRLEMGREGRGVAPQPQSSPLPKTGPGLNLDDTTGERAVRPKPQGLYIPPRFRGASDSKSTRHLTSPLNSPGSDAHDGFGSGPRVELPRFDGSNPRLWQARCEDYFSLWGTAPALWIPYASAQFEGSAARCLESVQRRMPRATWEEFCVVLQARFGRNQH